MSAGEADSARSREQDVERRRDRNTSDTPILVTGAAGGQRGSTGFNTGSEGSTGNVVARLLLESGLPVRAFVHRIDERSDELSALGAEVVNGDLLDIASVRRAVAGVRRAYFVYQSHPM